MGAIKTDLIRMTERFFASQLAYANPLRPTPTDKTNASPKREPTQLELPLTQPQTSQPRPQTNRLRPHTPANQTHPLPRRVYILLQNSYPMSVYTDAETANYEMHTCIKGDEYESARTGEVIDNLYEVLDMRLSYAKIDELFGK